MAKQNFSELPAEEKDADQNEEPDSTKSHITCYTEQEHEKTMKF